jgi:hypothetical protein
MREIPDDAVLVTNSGTPIPYDILITVIQTLHLMRANPAQDIDLLASVLLAERHGEHES